MVSFLNILRKSFKLGACLKHIAQERVVWLTLISFMASSAFVPHFFFSLNFLYHLILVISLCE